MSSISNKVIQKCIGFTEKIPAIAKKDVILNVCTKSLPHHLVKTATWVFYNRAAAFQNLHVHNFSADNKILRPGCLIGMDDWNVPVK